MWHVTTILTFSMQLKLLDNKPTEIKKEDSPMFYRRVGVIILTSRSKTVIKTIYTRVHYIYYTICENVNRILLFFCCGAATRRITTDI